MPVLILANIPIPRPPVSNPYKYCFGSTRGRNCSNSRAMQCNLSYTYACRIVVVVITQKSKVEVDGPMNS